MYTAQDMQNPIIRVTRIQYLTLKAVEKGEVIGCRSPYASRIIGAQNRVISVLIERGWVEKIFLNPNTDAYALTALGHKALCRLLKTKKGRGGNREIFL